jgi:hypothetical protein
MQDFLNAQPGNIRADAARDINIQGDVLTGNKVTVNSFGGADHIMVEWKDTYIFDDRVRSGTRLLKQGLAQLQSPLRGILFFDRFEQATEPTCRWLLNHLFAGLRQNVFKNLVVVIASAKPFDCFKERGWHYTTLHQKLGGLPEEAIREYWLKIRGLPEAELEKNMETLRSEGCSPLALSILAQQLERSA